MRDKDKPKARCIVNLIREIRKMGTLFPDDKIELPDWKPATHIGALEEGDIQVDYLQIHIFELFAGKQVVLEIPSLNRNPGELLYWKTDMRR